MYIRLFAAVAAALLLPACSIHPLPEDVTGVTTYQIVRQIRCETRSAVIAIIVRELRREADDGDPIAKRLIDEYDADPESISAFNPNLFPGSDYAQYRNLYNVIYTAAIIWEQPRICSDRGCRSSPSLLVRTQIARGATNGRLR